MTQPDDTENATEAGKFIPHRGTINEGEQPAPEFRSSRGSGQMLRGTIISNPGELIRDHRNNHFLPLELVGDGNSDDAPAIQAMHDEGARTDWRDSYTIDGTGRPLDLVIEMMGQALAVVGEYTDVSVRLSGKDLTGLHDFLAENTAAFIAFGESLDALATERKLTLYAQKEVRHLQAELATSNSRIRSITTDLKNTKAELKKAKKAIARAEEQSRQADIEAQRDAAERSEDYVDLDALRRHLHELTKAEILRRGGPRKLVPVHDFVAPQPDLRPGDMFAMHPSEHEPPDFVPERVARWAYLAIGGAIMAAAILAAQFLTS